MKKPFVLISAAATLILLIGAAALLMGYVHTPPQPRAVQTFDAADEVGGFEAALEERTAGEAKYIRKLYSVQTGELPPQPKAACYGVTTDPQEVQAVIDAAAVLLDGQETFWNADIDFMPNSEMWYYRDDSILVVAWQEAIEGRLLVRRGEARRRLPAPAQDKRRQLPCRGTQDRDRACRGG